MKLDYIEGNDMIKQIEKGSLSHKFLSLIFDKYEAERGINICDVPWRTLKQLILCIVVCMAIVFLVATLVGLIIALLSAVLSIWVVPSWLHCGFPMYGTVFWCAVWLGLLIYGLIETYEGNIPILPTWLKKREEEPSPPSLISIWWKSFKEKTCVKIVVSDNVEEV